MRVCECESCERPAAALGLCASHYARYRAQGASFDPSPIRQGQPRICTVDGCEEKSWSRGLCRPHHRRATTDPTDAVVPVGPCRCADPKPEAIELFGFIRINDVFECANCGREVRT